MRLALTSASLQVEKVNLKNFDFELKPTCIKRNCDFFEVAKLLKKDSLKLNLALHKREHKKAIRKNGSKNSFINFLPPSYF